MPLNLFRGVQMGDFFENTFHHCLTVWNLPGQSVLFTKDYVQEMFRETSQSYIRRYNFTAAIDPLGFLDATRYIKVSIQIAYDLIMIFQQLFWATPRQQKLSFRDLRRELELYRVSRIRDTIHRGVEGEVKLGNAFSAKKLVKVIKVVADDRCDIAHSEAVKRHKPEEVASLGEPPFVELPELPELSEPLHGRVGLRQIERDYSVEEGYEVDLNPRHSTLVHGGL